MSGQFVMLAVVVTVVLVVSVVGWWWSRRAPRRSPRRRPGRTKRHTPGSGSGSDVVPPAPRTVGEPLTVRPTPGGAASREVTEK